MAAAERIGMTLAEFIEQHNQQPFELINSEKRQKKPTIAGPNELTHLLFEFLNGYVTQHKLGLVRMEMTFVLPDKYDSNWVSGSRTPDILFIAAQRIDEYKAAHSDWI